MTVRDLRQKFLSFFELKGHILHPSGSLVPYDVTGKLDESLLFNGAGMVQFKPYFRGTAQPPNKRLVSCQKCVRTGDIETAGDLSHLTFFEMLGNFSFGDYFKEEAIAYSWEFLTSKEWLGLDPARLAFTVFEEDDEAFATWSSHLKSAGIDPSTRIFRLGEETNYWPAGAFSKGPPGPCGPNSEMFYWVPSSEPPPSGAYSREDYLRDEEAGKWLEIWNDVFIQYEWKGRLQNPERPTDGYVKEGLDPLPFRSIDTGMGLERTAAVLGGYQSIYDTDAFQPIIRKIEEISGYHCPYGRDFQKDRAIRIIADHVRTASFCIVDGVLPSNGGRGYVLRRLIRRAVLKGDRELNFSSAFLYKLGQSVSNVFGTYYPELNERQALVIETLRNEEELFRHTLKGGLQQFIRFLKEELQRNLVAANVPLGGMGGGAQHLFLQLQQPRDYLNVAPAGYRTSIFPGEEAFFLYDTYGFPLEVTIELAQEAGLEVDLAGYEQSLKEAQERSRGASAMEAVYGSSEDSIRVESKPGAPEHTVFKGYDLLSLKTRITKVAHGTEGDSSKGSAHKIALEETPFYAESGGQVGDRGVIRGQGFWFEVQNTQKKGNLIWHVGQLHLDTGKISGEDFFQEVEAKVDSARRREITRNHTATHLLHAALRQVLGKHVTQAGSYVGPEHLRFDFTHSKALTQEELIEVERIVNEQALAARRVLIHQDVPIQEAKQKGAMALFGEKYGDKVRVVQIEDFSIELCGGCHVQQTSEVGLFKILHESSAASGVRRIEAVTGLAAYAWTNEQQATLRNAANLLKTQPGELTQTIEKTLESLKEERKKREKLAQQGASSGADVIKESIGDIELALQKLDGFDAKGATLVADGLVDGNPRRVALVAAREDDKITFVCKVGELALKNGAHAGNLLREVAKIAGGGGGGRPDFATAGGKDPEKVDEALAVGKKLLEAQLSAQK